MRQVPAWAIFGVVMATPLAACGTSASSDGPRGDDSGSEAASTNPGAGDAANDVTVDSPIDANDGGPAIMDAADGSSANNVVCPPLPDGGSADSGVGPGESAASGCLVGAAVSCSLWDIGAAVYVKAAPDGGAPLSYTFVLSDLPGGQVTCAVPSDSSYPQQLVEIPLNGIEPGTYSSSQSTAPADCSPTIYVGYSLPESAFTQVCQAASGGRGCPVGCLGFCMLLNDSGADGSVYCECDGPTYGAGYSASGPCGSTPASGSWQVVLTSVAPYAGDAGVPAGTALYTVHGSVTADLVGSSGDGGVPMGDSATLSLTF